MLLRIVIVNYRVADLAIACLESLRDELSAMLPDSRVTVVENGSGSGEGPRFREAIAARQWGTWVDLIELDRNLGFSGGNNKAIEGALAERARYVLLLNPDTVVQPGAVSRLVQFLEAHPEAGIVGSRLVFADGGAQGSPFRFPSVASELDRGLALGPVSRLLRRWAICLPKPPGPAEVDWVAGASMMVRSEVFTAIGLLDESFFTYFEDVDFCKRAKQAGWSTWYVPESVVVHLEGQSSQVGSSVAKRLPAYWHEARRRYFLKHHGMVGAALADTAFLLGYAVRKALGRKRAGDTPHLLRDSFQHSVFGSQMTGAALWTFGGFAAGQIIRLVANLITTRLLAPELFGLMALVNTFVTGLLLLSDTGTAVSIVREQRGEDERFLNTAWTLQAVRGVAVWVLAAVASWPLAAVYGDTRLLWLMPVVAASAIAAGLQSTSLFTSVRRLRLGRLVTVEVGSQLAAAVAMVAWAWLWPGVWALVAAAILAPVLKSIASHWMDRSRRDRIGWDRESARALFQFGRWIWMSTGLMFLATQVDRMLLGKLLGLEQLGVYGIAVTLAELPRALTSAVCANVVYPRLAQQAHGPREVLRAATARYRRPLLLLTGCAITVLAGGGNWLVRVLYDSRYSEAAWMLPVLAVGLWPSVLATTADQSLIAIGKPQYVSQGNLGKLVFTVAGILIGFRLFGTAGAVWAVALNDLPLYARTLAGLSEERLSVWKEDLMATAMLAASAGGVWLAVRWLTGLP